MDSTLLTVVLLLVFATALALIRARRRDKCLKDFEDFQISLAEKGGDLTWGRAWIYTTGLEIVYVEPVQAREGHLERSFIFYKEQYEAMDGLYRYPEGLRPEAQERRRRIIEQTANPGFLRRFGRRLRNWISMVRDALLEAASLVLGAARSRATPGSVVLSSQEAQIKSLSSEIIGHAGNAFDPLLEKHLFRQVVVEVTRGERRFSYCGWLKDYTSQFVEIVDAFAQTDGAPLPLAAYAPEGEGNPGVQIQVEAARLSIRNGSDHLLYVQHVEAGAWRRPMGCVLPPGFTADLTLPPGIEAAALRAWVGSCERVDMVVPRTHALVRHAADGSEAVVSTARPGTVAGAVAKGPAPGTPPAPGPPDPVPGADARTPTPQES